MKDALGSPQSVLVLGGRSEIGLATVRALARGRLRKAVLAVRRPAGRDLTPLEGAGVDVDLVEFDARDYASHAGFVADVFERHGDFDTVVLAFGVLGDQAAQEHDPERAREVIETNFLGAASVMVSLFEAMRAQGHGVVVVLSSVAAERPRRSNFVYGSSKAGLDALAHGFAQSLDGTGVSVLVVRPGFVRTRMTAGLDPAPFSTTPETVADAIVDGLRHGRTTVWVPPVLRIVMSLLRHLPFTVFRRLPL